MCRYSDHDVRPHMACLRCRRAFKSRRVCPDCHQPMVNMGRDFKAPPRQARDQWEKVRRLAEAGFTFDSCGCGGPGYRPKRKREVAEFVAAKSKEIFWNERDEFRFRVLRLPYRSRRFMKAR